MAINWNWFELMAYRWNCSASGSSTCCHRRSQRSFEMRQTGSCQVHTHTHTLEHTSLITIQLDLLLIELFSRRRLCLQFPPRPSFVSPKRKRSTGKWTLPEILSRKPQFDCPVSLWCHIYLLVNQLPSVINRTSLLVTDLNVYWARVWTYWNATSRSTTATFPLQFETNHYLKKRKKKRKDKTKKKNTPTQKRKKK